MRAWFGNYYTVQKTRRHQDTTMSWYKCSTLLTICMVFTIISSLTDAVDGSRETSTESSQNEHIFLGNFPSFSENDPYAPHSRRKRAASNDTGDKSIWEEIEEFYKDKNNMAMYCVLPIMVLIYGGCSAIYCVHKCRQYLKRRKHKRLKEVDCDSIDSDRNDLNQNSKRVSNQEEERPISQISQAWPDLGDGGSGQGITWSGQTEASDSTSPLPWQIPDKTAFAANLAAQRTSRAGYTSDKLQDDEIRLEEGRKSAASAGEPRSASRTSMLDDALIEEELNQGSKRNRSDNLKIVSAAAEVDSDNFGESTDDSPNPPMNLMLQRQQQQQLSSRRAKIMNDQSRTQANFDDYVSRSSKTKATDYSRFAEAKPIEIVPLTADPSLKVWDPLHRRPWGEKGQSRAASKIEPIGAVGGGNSGAKNRMKDEMMARYDALSTFQMAKKAAEILKTNAVEKSPFQRKPNKKKHIFIAE